MIQKDWIRFYALDGFVSSDNRGWDNGYNFGSRDAVLIGWRAALKAGAAAVTKVNYSHRRLRRRH
jgi:hypothetical protein